MTGRSLTVLLVVWMVVACAAPHSFIDQSGTAVQNVDRAGPQYVAGSDQTGPSRRFSFAWRDFWLWVAFFPFHVK